jgi:hypothetical protein
VVAGVVSSSNTTTSMGRLTLNVLLSFAQFDLVDDHGIGPPRRDVGEQLVQSRPIHRSAPNNRNGQPARHLDGEGSAHRRANG